MKKRAGRREQKRLSSRIIKREEGKPQLISLPPPSLFSPSSPSSSYPHHCSLSSPSYLFNICPLLNSHLFISRAQPHDRQRRYSTMLKFVVDQRLAAKQIFWLLSSQNPLNSFHAGFISRKARQNSSNQNPFNSFHARNTKKSSCLLYCVFMMRELHLDSYSVTIKLHLTLFTEYEPFYLY